MRKTKVLIIVGAVLVAALTYIGVPGQPEGPLPKLLSTVSDSLSEAQINQLERFKAEHSYQDIPETNLKYSLQFEELQQYRISGVYAGKVAIQSQDTSELLEAGRLMNEAMAWERNVGNSGEFFNFFLEQSESAYQFIIDLDSTNTRARLGMATVLADGKGAVMLGVQELLAVSRMDSMNLEANIRLGRFAIMSQQIDKVIPRYRKVLAVQANNTEALLTIGNTYLSNNQMDSALVYYKQALPFVQNTQIQSELQEQIELLEKRGSSN